MNRVLQDVVYRQSWASLFKPTKANYTDNGHCTFFNFTLNLTVY